MSGVASAIGLGVATVGSAIIGANAAEDAADTVSASADRAAGLTNSQFNQTRKDLAPFRDVAVGELTDESVNEDAFNAARLRYDQDVADIKGSFGVSRVARGQEAAAIAALGNRPTRQDFTTQNFEGGALQELAGFGRSKVLEGDFIPASDIPTFEVSRDIPQFQGGIGDIPLGDIPEFTRRNLQDDPGFQFRQAEQERAINRNSAVGGKVASGNRLEEIIARSGDLASQEFGAAFNRNLTEFDIARQREQEQFGRERSREADEFGRDLTGFGLDRSRESELFGRDLTQFGIDANRESDIYNRGVSSFGRAKGEEADYLNRLANLSNIGQTATTNTANFGANAASTSGNAAIAAGNARAAGQIGQANAVQSAIGDITSLAARYRPGGVTTTSTPVTGFDL